MKSKSSKTDAVGGGRPIRVLYSFPHKLGGPRICGIAWQQVKGIVAAGADVLAFPGVYSKPVPGNLRVRPTLSRGKVRLPYRVLGKQRSIELHDWIVARRLEKLAGQVDIVHVWPVGALQTLRTAKRLGIPTVLERCNAHTRFAYEVVQKECEHLGVEMPPGHEHAYNEGILGIEEEEYRLADGLLCPSEFVVKTFLDYGFPKEKLVRHIYGYDENVYYPNPQRRSPERGLNMLFVGVCAVRKGLHYALEAWLASTGHREGTFTIAGEFLPAYAERLAPMLSHPSVKVLGHRNDVPELVRKSDILVLPSIEEGFGLVCTEAMGSGCIPLVSEACTDLCQHMNNALVHRVGDVEALRQHITLLDQDRALLEKLQTGCLSSLEEITWKAAGTRLVEAYGSVIAAHASSSTKNLLTARPLCL